MAGPPGPGEPVALLGTGIMGAAMARSMLRAGLAVRVWNRTRARAEALVAVGAVTAASPADAVRDARVIVTMLADGDAVLAVMSAARGGLRAGQVWAQASTVGAGAIEELAAFAAEHGLVFADSPVVGTRQPAEQGALTVIAAGPPQARAELEPVFAAIGQRTTWLGTEPGAASRLKLVVNSWVLALTAAAGEAVALAQGLDIDPRVFLQAVSGGPLDSRYLEAKAGAILAGDMTASFTVEMAVKDAGLITAAAAAAGIRLDVAEAAAQRFRRAATLGHATEDMAAAYYASFDT